MTVIDAQADKNSSVVFNNSIGGLMEILSQILLVLLMDRVWCGRKRLLIGEFAALLTIVEYASFVL